MRDEDSSPRFRIRLVFGPDEMMGPGKAELLERIQRTGSIAAAGREMGMSYKRAWQLVETLNAMFRSPWWNAAAAVQKAVGRRLPRPASPFSRSIAQLN